MLRPNKRSPERDDRLRFGILTQYYEPETGAPQARLGHLAAAMTAAGHEVKVLTAVPNYPIGKVYPGHSRVYEREQRNGVDVLRSSIWPTKAMGLVPRSLSYLSFVASSVVAGFARLGGIDFVLVESPPLFLGASGFALSRAFGADMIFNVSDLWPDSAVRVGVVAADSPLVRAATTFERWCYERAWLVTAQTQGIVDDITERFPHLHPLYVPNGADTSLFGPGNRSEDLRASLAPGDHLVATFAGLHGAAQGLDIVLDAAEALIGDPVTIVLVGDGPEKARLVEEATSRKLENIKFLEPRTRSEIATLLASSDAAVITLAPGFEDAVPSKLYEAAASGLPIVLVHDGEAARLVERARCGTVVPHGRADQLAAGLRELAVDAERRRTLATAARTFAEEHSRDAATKSLIEAVERRWSERTSASRRGRR
jgi:glycosyltransferase involved in cell wall biosynthesis